ncbi:MAG: hypothetical protein JWM89_3613 [Acidimicrobiales bacterium]|nr:hypothetical protein [Acidimicrobiales bacterium]
MASHDDASSAHGSGLGRVAEAIGERNRLDALADPLHRLIDSRLPAGTADVLRGRWLGHPFHPLLTDLPIGCWTSAWTLDLLGGERSRPAADLLLGLGVVTAVPTVVTGWADWATLPRRARRVGLVHAASNAMATGLFAASWLARRRGERRRGVILCQAGVAVASFGGFLGGHLSFAADHAPAARGADAALDDRVDGHAQVAGAPSDNTTLVVVLADARAAGFVADFRPVGESGAVRCSSCRSDSAAGAFRELAERRLEGASDPDDMLLLVTGRCPACDAAGVMTLSYGPAAGESDAAVVAALA